MVFENKYKFDKLQRNMYVILKKDIIFGNNEEGSINEQNGYRGQLGLVLSSKSEGGDKDKYIVGFQDINADIFSLSDGYINELELTLDEVIPLILPQSSRRNQLKEGTFFRECYTEKTYLDRSFPIMKTVRIVEYDQTEKQNFESISCPETEFYIKHNKTSTQFEPQSLITFQDVCKDINSNFFIYPGQIGVILKKIKRTGYEEKDYVQVLLAPFLFRDWNIYKHYSESQLTEFLKDKKNGVIIHINKYNLVPIFQTKLTLEKDGQTQIRTVSMLYDTIGSLSEEDYKKYLETLNLPIEQIKEKVKLLNFFKKETSND